MMLRGGLWTAALLPFLLCGLMCLGTVALAAVGLRRNRSRRRDCSGSEDDSGKVDQATFVAMTGTADHANGSVSHPVFARIYHRLSRQIEAKGNDEHRRELLDGLTGRVIEVGAGNGLNFSRYPAAVTEVVAVEPEPYLRQRARESAEHATVAISVVDGAADRLPAEDASFDAAVVSLVLCSVTDQQTALAEAHRALRPGGELRFYEHVRSEHPRLARVQRGLDRTIWPRVGGGCHASRDTFAAIEASGFTVEIHRRFDFRPALVAAITAPHILGTARRP